MDEKDRIIIEIYNEAKERARCVHWASDSFFPLLLSDVVVLMLFHLRFFRVNGFKKQMEILRQKHAEFKEKYKRTDVGDDK